MIHIKDKYNNVTFSNVHDCEAYMTQITLQAFKMQGLVFSQNNDAIDYGEEWDAFKLDEAIKKVIVDNWWEVTRD